MTEISQEHALPIPALKENFEIVNQESERAGWLKRHKTKFLLGIAATSAVVTLATGELGEIKDDVLDAAPWVGGGVAASEVLFVAGAGMMAASAGSKLGNPFTIKDRIPEIASKAANSSLFKAGFVINTVGAVGDFAVLSTGIAKELPPQAWGGLGFTLTDLAGTVAVRKAMIDAGRKYGEQEFIVGTQAEAKKDKLSVRHATIEDIDRLAEIDLSRFRKAYGHEVPSKDEIVEVFSQRYENSKGWMFVTEVNGQIEGFITAFRTNKSPDEFVSWEDSTNNGTLNGVVDPEGEYIYVANMTVNPKAMELGGETALIANVLANGVREGLKIGYFVSRMPLFKRWLQGRALKNGLDVSQLSSDSLQALAEEYVAQKREDKEGRLIRKDHELRMYENSGFSLTRVVPNGFQDEASMNFGVVCVAESPIANSRLNNVRPVRKTLAYGIRKLANKPKTLERFI